MSNSASLGHLNQILYINGNDHKLKWIDLDTHSEEIKSDSEDDDDALV